MRFAGMQTRLDLGRLLHDQPCGSHLPERESITSSRATHTAAIGR